VSTVPGRDVQFDSKVGSPIPEQGPIPKQSLIIQK
jgi:hypothetical protein